MKIRWFGHSFFQIKTKFEGRERTKIFIDPFEEDTGLKLPNRLSGEIVMVTHPHSHHNNVKAISGNPFVIEGPGEYEVRKVFIHGISSFHDQKKGKENGRNTIYIVENEGIRLCHMGDFNQAELTEKQMEKIGEVDILLIPIGGGKTVSAKGAAKIMSQVEPRITIPMHYALPKLKVKLDPLDNFLKAFGIKAANPVEELSVKKKSLPKEDEAKIIVLKH
ncbi:MAG: hypothetical protein GF370_02340 [Candidatus Nealsonbacteria bacterium]|nr:hypothetical protein [Candidatus Nealsonbacteria bacterium]